MATYLDTFVTYMLSPFAMSDAYESDNSQGGHAELDGRQTNYAGNIIRIVMLFSLYHTQTEAYSQICYTMLCDPVQ